ncbi:MAG TPA: histidinol-phosphate transaminase [Burkholderiaceae bacterium]|nr:histidinol-phosphate transaminase [Burkholderiaceae bacterium]
MSRLFSETLQGLSPYVPGEQPREPIDLKLNTNEHPYGPSPRAIEAIRQAAGERLRLYPDYSAFALREAIANLHQIHPDQVFVGNGSDEVLAHVFKALFQRPGVLLVPDITYSFYKTYSAMFQVKQHHVPLAPDFSINVADYTGPQTQAIAGIIFANPNAPTGLALGLDEIAGILRANPDTPVVVDEAYVDFGASTAVPLLEQFDNLVVVHTMSKSRALAGLRVGFAMASKEIVQALVRVKDSFNSYPLDTLAQAGALASVQDDDYFRKSCQAVIQARATLASGLQELGFDVLPSQTNFVFVRHPAYDARAISQALRERGILVRHFNQPRIEQYLRITVGTLDQCRRLCSTLAEIFDDLPVMN